MSVLLEVLEHSSELLVRLRFEESHPVVPRVLVHEGLNLGEPLGWQSGDGPLHRVSVDDLVDLRCASASFGDAWVPAAGLLRCGALGTPPQRLDGLDGEPFDPVVASVLESLEHARNGQVAQPFVENHSGIGRGFVEVVERVLRLLVGDVCRLYCRAGLALAVRPSGLLAGRACKQGTPCGNVCPVPRGACHVVADAVHIHSHPIGHDACQGHVACGRQHEHLLRRVV